MDVVRETSASWLKHVQAVYTLQIVLHLYALVIYLLTHCKV